MNMESTELKIIENPEQWGPDHRRIEFAKIDHATLPPTRTVVLQLDLDEVERLAHAMLDMAKLAKSGPFDAME